MASSEVTPASTETFYLPEFIAHGDPAQEAESANATMTLDVVRSPSLRDSMPPSSAPFPPSQEVFTTTSIPCRQPQSAYGTSMPHLQCVPIQPKIPVMPRHTQITTSGNLGKATNLPKPPSEMAPISHAVSAVVKGKRKRSQSAQMQRNNIPEGFRCIFPISGKSSPEREQGQTTSRKRIKSARACLRCQIYKERVGQYRSLRQLQAMWLTRE